MADHPACSAFIKSYSGSRILTREAVLVSLHTALRLSILMAKTVPLPLAVQDVLGAFTFPDTLGRGQCQHPGVSGLSGCSPQRRQRYQRMNVLFIILFFLALVAVAYRYAPK